MPSFVCDYCQETLKKAKLDQHTQRCRNASFSCIDCYRTFKGAEYRDHFSCITEVQKYHKKAPTPPSTPQKSEIKALDDSNKDKNTGSSDGKSTKPTKASKPASTENAAKSKSTENVFIKSVKEALIKNSSPMTLKAVKKHLKKAHGKDTKAFLFNHLQFTIDPQNSNDFIINFIN